MNKKFKWKLRDVPSDTNQEYHTNLLEYFKKKHKIDLRNVDK